MKAPIRPTDPEFVHAAERILDEWSTEAARFRLVERAGVYRLETWDLFRWVTAEQGFQAVARRVADAPGPGENVVRIAERRLS